MEKLTGADINAPGNAVIVQGTDKEGAVETTFPLNQFLRLQARAKQTDLSYKLRNKARTVGNKTINSIRNSAIMSPATIHVGGSPLETQPTVAIIFDKDTERQLVFRISAEAAEQVAQNLLKESRQARDQVPKQ